jgi:hypothetical protein
MTRRRWIVGIALLVTLAPAAPETMRALTNQARAAHALRVLPREQRSQVIFAWQYTIARELRSRTGPEDAIDIIMAVPESRDLAVFAAGFLAPRPIRFFDGTDAWKQRRRAVFFHDDLAANAPNRALPGKAAVTVILDPRKEPPYRILD